MSDISPDIVDVEVPAHGRLRLTFSDGVVGEIDVLHRMRGPIFDGARDPEGFAQVAVDAETGTVTWPGGADLAPDVLYDVVLARQTAAAGG